MRVAGIDQSTNKTGFAVMEDGKLIHCELIDLSKFDKDYILRIQQLRDVLMDKLKEYDVQVVAIENIVNARNGGFESTRKLAETLGVVKVLLLDLELAYDCPNPPQWRKGKEFGRTRAIQKSNAITYVNYTYGLELRPYNPSSRDNDDDIAESICIAEFIDKKINK